MKTTDFSILLKWEKTAQGKRLAKVRHEIERRLSIARSLNPPLFNRYWQMMVNFK